MAHKAAFTQALSETLSVVGMRARVFAGRSAVRRGGRILSRPMLRTTSWTTSAPIVLKMHLSMGAVPAHDLARTCPQAAGRGLTVAFARVRVPFRRLDRAALEAGRDHRPYGVEVTAVAAVDHPPGRRAGLAALAVVTATALVGCTGNSGSPPPTITASVSNSQGDQSPPSVVTVANDRDRVLQRYGEFFVALPKASLMPESKRNEVLAQYLAGPAYSAVVKSLSSQAAFGKALYGQPTLTPQITDLRPNTAVIRDCQDTSNSGVQDVKTGDRETKGVPRTLVVTDLRRVDGLWKITKIDYRGPKC
jgi:hypothetical protein